MWSVQLGGVMKEPGEDSSDRECQMARSQAISNGDSGRRIFEAPSQILKIRFVPGEALLQTLWGLRKVYFGTEFTRHVTISSQDKSELMDTCFRRNPLRFVEFFATGVVTKHDVFPDDPGWVASPTNEGGEVLHETNREGERSIHPVLLIGLLVGAIDCADDFVNRLWGGPILQDGLAVGGDGEECTWEETLGQPGQAPQVRV